MSGNITPYTNKITSEHNQKPNYMDGMAALVQPLADEVQMLELLPSLFDLDDAVSTQLDVVGLWIGKNRNIPVPLTGVYFSFGVDGLGFGQGVWLGPGDSTTSLKILDDPHYRLLLYAEVEANHWNGTIVEASRIMNELLNPYGLTIVYQDNQDMSITILVLGYDILTTDPVAVALLTGDYLTVRPETVRITGYVTASIPGTPIFGFGIDNSLIGGFGHGSWAKEL